MTVQRGQEAGPGLIRRIRLLLRWVVFFCSVISSLPPLDVPFRPSVLVAGLLAPRDTLESTLHT